MIRVELIVTRASSFADDDLGDPWGEWDFVSLPRAGDHIDIQRDSGAELLKVCRVVHATVQHPLPRSDAPYRQRKQPSIRVIATEL